MRKTGPVTYEWNSPTQTELSKKSSSRNVYGCMSLKNYILEQRIRNDFDWVYR